MRFKYCNIPVTVKNLKVYCKDPALKEYLTMSLQVTIMTTIDDQHINPLYVFIMGLQEETPVFDGRFDGPGGITNLVFEKGDIDDEENGIIH